MPMVNNYINITCPPEFKKIKQYKNSAHICQDILTILNDIF